MRPLRKFGTADLSERFPWSDSIQSNHVFPEPRVPRAQTQPAKRDKGLGDENEKKYCTNTRGVLPY